MTSVRARPDYADAVRDLRRQCGLSQYTLALELGVTPHTVSQWETARQQPGSFNYLKLQELAKAKEKDSLARLFGEKLRGPSARLAQATAGGRGDRPAESARRGEPASEDQEEILRDFNDAETGINILYEAAAAGQPGAADTLRDLADRINKRAGDWRRMKYRRPK